MATNPSLLFICNIEHKYSKEVKHSETDREISKSTEHFWSPRMALDFVAGCLGGCAGVIVGHPLDTVKVHLQTQDHRNPRYTGTWDCIRKIVAQDKLSGLYRGMTSPMGGIAFVNAIVFGIYGNVQRATEFPESLSSHALAGSVAGFCQSIVCSPMELAKTRLQLQNAASKEKQFKGPLDCLRYIIKTEGLRGTMRGVMSTAARDVPAFSSYFITYEYMMRQCATPNVFFSLCAGGIAGTVSWLICYPVDVIKTCIQADDLSNPKYKGYMDCVRQGYKSDGMKFFFRGLNSTLLRSFPTNAACFFVVAWIMKWSKGSGVDVVVQTGDAMPIVNSAANKPLTHVVNSSLECVEEKLSNQLNITAQSQSSLKEAACPHKGQELPQDSNPSASNEKYYVYEDERIIIQHFSSL